MIKPATYECRAEEFPDRHYGTGTQLGVIAQQVKKAMPELVTTDTDGHLQVKFSDIPIYLLAGLSELKTEKDAEIAALKLANAEKDTEMDQIRAQAEQIKALLCAKFPDEGLCRSTDH